VRDSLRGLFLTLTDDDVRVAIMGETGSDIKLSKTAKKLFPYDIECKNTEGWKKVYDAYDQADGHGEDQPLVFIKMNRRNPLVVVDAKHFMRLNNSGYITDPVKVEYMDERKR
tara:strand:+ start:281 stop:619 length:339 start_codon:yes stop_codon:yes gene_type:complete